MQLKTPLSAVLRTTKEHLAALEGMGMRTVENFLLYLPRAYEDLTAIQTLRTAPLDQKATFRGTIHSLKRVRIRGGKFIVTGQFTDTEESRAEAVWFNQPHVLRMLSEGDPVVLTGKLVRNGTRLQIQSPQFESAVRENLLHAGRLVPIYPEHDLINTKWLREKMVLVREAAAQLPENLPEEVVKEEGLMGRKEAIRALHFPGNGGEVERARQRMAFEEMYLMQCDVLQKKKEWQGERQERLKIPMDVELIRAFFQSLNFTPTGSQKIAIYEILRDMEKDRPMSRLLEGDVGSGKTLVATTVLANVIRHGGQCALMVPTEVLARQHVASIGKMLISFHTYLEQRGAGGALRMKNPSVALLTGSMPAADARRVSQGLATGTVDLVIGTHALIQEQVQFRNLQL
ncbi:MAG: DEAD/DEAH box helicase, partial [Candidatus Peribacteraceae bacterium]|nr:DEAD/DEAH box helicase [Candidatus Peribacteraceae bacterium]